VVVETLIPVVEVEVVEEEGEEVVQICQE